MVRQNRLEVQHLALLLSLAVMRAISWLDTAIFTVTQDHYGVQLRLVLEVCEMCVLRGRYLHSTADNCICIMVNLHKQVKLLNRLSAFHPKYPDSVIGLLF